MEKPPLAVLDAEFSIYRFSPETTIPPSLSGSSFYWVGKTDEELSVVCDASLELAGGKREAGWSCFRVRGPLDFSLTGVLAGIASALASAQISIFALSTFDTDYILVKSVDLERAVVALKKSGYEIK